MQPKLACPEGIENPYPEPSGTVIRDTGDELFPVLFPLNKEEAIAAEYRQMLALKGAPLEKQLEAACALLAAAEMEIDLLEAEHEHLVKTRRDLVILADDQHQPETSAASVTDEGVDTSEAPHAAAIAGANELQVLARYSGPTGTFQSLNVTMPVDGVLDLSLQGVRALVYDSARRRIGDSGYTPSNYQIPLPQGEYLLQYQYWSANARAAVAYSPAVLPVQQLPRLRNRVYSSSTQTTSYYRVRVDEPTTIYFTGAGVNKTFYNRKMRLIRHLGDQDETVTLRPGLYVVKLFFWSSNAKSVSVTSAGLP